MDQYYLLAQFLAARTPPAASMQEIAAEFLYNDPVETPAAVEWLLARGVASVDITPWKRVWLKPVTAAPALRRIQRAGVRGIYLSQVRQFLHHSDAPEIINTLTTCGLIAVRGKKVFAL